MSRFFSTKFDDLEPYVPGEQPGNIDNVLKLNTNENPFPPSKNVINALSEDEICRLLLYPDPYCTKLNETLAKELKVDFNNVYTGNGSDEVLAFCFYAFSDKGFAFPDLTYGFYSVFASLFNAETTIVPLRDDFSINIQDYDNITKNIIISNPNSPAGLFLPLDEIKKLIEKNKDRLIIIDEAYIDFGAETAVPLTKIYDNLLIIRTFSKSRSLAGGRLGAAIGNESLIRDLNTIKFSFNPYNVNRLTQIAGTEAIKDKEYFEYTRSEIIKAREYTKYEMKKLGFSVFDSMANFVFAGRHDKISGKEYFEKLRKKNVIVRYFNTPREKDYIRISIATIKEMQKFIDITMEILQEK